MEHTPEFSELVLTRKVLLVAQNRTVLPLLSAKARELGKKMYARAKGLRIKNWPEPVLFGRPERTNGMRPKINPNPSPNPNDLEQLQASKEAERTKIRVA